MWHILAITLVCSGRRILRGITMVSRTRARGESSEEPLRGRPERVLVRGEGQAPAGGVRDDDPGDVDVVRKERSEEVCECVGLGGERHVGEGHGEDAAGDRGALTVLRAGPPTVRRPEKRSRH